MTSKKMTTEPFSRLPLAALICATLALSACSSDDDDDAPTPDNGGQPGDNTGDNTGDSTEDGTDDSLDPTGDVARFGLVRLSQPDGPGDDGDAFASFVQFTTAVSADQLSGEFLPAADTCRVENDDDDSDDDDLFAGVSGRPFEFVSAGNALMFTSEAGTWLTLPLIDIPGFKGYRPESRPLPTPFPSDLTLDIPGETFPAFAAVPLGDVAPLSIQVPGGDDDVAASTGFSWESAGDAQANTRVEIELEFDDQGTDGEDIEVLCSATDDGEFSLPQSVLDQLPAGAAGSLDMERVTVEQRRDGDALLVTRHEATGGF